MSIFYTFIIAWAICIALAGIAYVIFKPLYKVSSGLGMRMPKIKMPKWGESDLAKKWKALPINHKMLVIIIAILPMAGALTYHHIKQQKRA